MRRNLRSHGSGDRNATATALAWVLSFAILVPIAYVAGWWAMIPAGLLVLGALWSITSTRRLSDPGVDGPRHPIDLGRVFVHEGEAGIALHQVWEMEKRAGP